MGIIAWMLIKNKNKEKEPEIRFNPYNPPVDIEYIK